MVDFLVRHKLLNPSQHGFLKARSNLLFFGSIMRVQCYHTCSTAFKKSVAKTKGLCKYKINSVINFFNRIDPTYPHLLNKMEASCMHCQCSEWKTDYCKISTRKKLSNKYTFPIVYNPSDPLTHHPPTHLHTNFF